MAEDGRVSIFVGRRGARTSDTSEWRALIRDERLRRTDTVAVRREGETTWMPAGEVPELKALFDEVAVEPTPVAAPPPAAPFEEPIAPPIDAYVLPATYAEDHPAEPHDMTAPPGFGSESATPAVPVTPRPGAEPRKGGGCATAFWLLLVVVGIIVFLAVRSCQGPTSPYGPVAGTEAEAATVTRYAARDLNVRDRVSTEATIVGRLRRGEPVVGRWVGRDRDWLEVTEGEFLGRYIYAANLSANPPA